MRFVRPYENWANWTNFLSSWENGEFFGVKTVVPTTVIYSISKFATKNSGNVFKMNVYKRRWKVFISGRKLQWVPFWLYGV